jgi:hypothetical protein
MEISTKYNIGDVVKYAKNLYGEISNIVINPPTYAIKYNYVIGLTHVAEDNIICKLIPESERIILNFKDEDYIVEEMEIETDNDVGYAQTNKGMEKIFDLPRSKTFTFKLHAKI